MKRAVLIAGPTASGKSALALALAERLGGTIVNADSMQVYRDLRVITARPTEAEEARVPHRLYGHVDAAENYSVGRWLGDAVAAMEDIASAGGVPILAGGTGLYFTALKQGLAPVPPVPEAVRAEVRARLAAEGAPALHRELAGLDPAAAQRLPPGDALRITRALEVVVATGRPLSDWQRDAPPSPLVGWELIPCFVTRPRADLYERIDRRFEAMLADGAMAEVERLARRRLDPLLPAMKAHGVPWLIRYQAGEIPLAEAVAGGQRDTRRYTKRQITWFRHQLADWPVVGAEDALAFFLEQGRWAAVRQ